MYLTRTEADTIAQRTAVLEAHVDVQVVTAVVGKADDYPALPWKAFALGAALAALAAILVDARRPDWTGWHTGLLLAMAILGTGAASALLAMLAPAYARVFLPRMRRDAVVHRCAESMFLRHALFDTRGRNGILVLVCLFERKVEILADQGLHGRVGEQQWRSVIDRMTPALVAGRTADALLEGLAHLEAVLRARVPQGAAQGGNELGDRPLEERGAR